MVQGDLLGDKSSVKHVFVDGRRFEVPADAGAGAARRRRAWARWTARPGRPSMIRRFLLASALVAAAPLPSHPPSRRPTAPVTAIRNATILTVTKGTIDKGTIVIRDGKIAAVGANVDVPRGATEIDATGLFVMPGIIDAHTHIAVDGIGQRSSASRSRRWSASRTSSTPTTSTSTAAWPAASPTANVLHGSANAIGGKNAVIKLRWGKDAAGPALRGRAARASSSRSARTRSGPASAGGNDADRRYPATRMGVIDVIREAFVEARAYQAKWRDVRGRRQGRRRTAHGAAPRPASSSRSSRSSRASASCTRTRYRADEILQLLRVAEEFRFRIATLQHVLEGYKVADEIAKHGAGASTFSRLVGVQVRGLRRHPVQRRADDRSAASLVSINSDSAEEHRHLNQEAAKTMKYGGLTEDQALRLVTLNPAMQLGIDKRVGSIEVGKDADLVLYSAHPLSTFAVPQQVLIDGVVYFDRQKDLQQREARAKQKQALKDKEKAGSAPAQADAARHDAQGRDHARPRGATDEPAHPLSTRPARRRRGLRRRSPRARRPSRGRTRRRPAPSRARASSTVSGAVLENATVVIADGKILVGRPDGHRARGRPGDRRHGPRGVARLLRRDEPARAHRDRRRQRHQRHHRDRRVQPADRRRDGGAPGQRSHPRRARERHHARRRRARASASGFGGGGPVIGGQASAIHLDGWTIEEMLINRSVGMVVNWPSVQARSFDSGDVLGADAAVPRGEGGAGQADA